MVATYFILQTLRTFQELWSDSSPEFHEVRQRSQESSGADTLVHFTVTGAGTLRAVDNGNAATVESFQASERKAFSGMALRQEHG